MDSAHRAYLDRRHATSAWHGRSTPNHRIIASFDLTGAELSGWTLHRARRDTRGTPPALRTLWHRGEPEVELLAIDIRVCASVVAAHDQLLEVLANIESDAIERDTGSAAIGDVVFTLGHTNVGVRSCQCGCAGAQCWTADGGRRPIRTRDRHRALSPVVA